MAKKPHAARGNIRPSPQASDEEPRTELTTADFAKFFQEMWGYSPFDWQQRLAERVMNKTDPSGWPEAIALPTAAGKTACIDIAIFALAAQAHRLTDGRAITAPRRIFFVVDRRIIVDQTYNRAQKIAQSLQCAKNGMIKEVADRLRIVAHGACDGFEDARPLAVYALRGGMYRSESWARDPLQPTIVASTVDQIGSRLLFRAYGRSSGTWPIYAGLIANDSIVLLDEAHCAKPFLQTLQAVGKFRRWASEPLERPFYPVVMSATPPPNLSDVFADNSEESKSPDHILGRRNLARKLAKMKMVVKTSEANEMSGALANVAIDLLKGESPRAVVVFTNRVATAREAFRLLKERQTAKTVLLTGRMRQLDRDRISAKLDDLVSAQSDKRSLKESTIVVATQTLEVGADLDFDDLVTECASLDALRQRFGRLNRMGRPITSRAEILVREDQIKKDDNDPVYGTSLAKTWNWLDQVKDGDGRVNFGTADIDREINLLGGSVDELMAPTLDAPVMLPAHIDCWAQTGPKPHHSPDITPFLRGPEHGAAGVQICWRADLDLDKREDASLSLLKICPPSSVETMTVPIGVLKGWLTEKEHFSDNSSDIEGIADSAENTTFDDLPKVVRWRGSKTSKSDIISDISEIAPGDIIVVPTNHPAPHNRVGDFPFDVDKDELDIGDQAHRTTRAKCILRLHPNLTKSWPPELSAEKEQIGYLLARIKEYEEEYEEVGDNLAKILEALSKKEVSNRWSWLPDTAKKLLEEYGGVKMRRAYKMIGESLVIEGKRLVIDGKYGFADTHDADVFNDEDDSSSSSTSYKDESPVGLENHLVGVRKFARRYAQGCGLSEELTSALECSGLLHDLGKADSRFQSMLHGGSRPMGTLLAKSARMPRGKEYEQIRKKSEYPKHSRHELLTLRLVEGASDLITDDRHAGDLVLHLIGSHHGYCRPFAPVVVDDKRTTTSVDLHGHRFKWSGPTRLEKLDSGVSDRYWRLTRRYGWWGLAWIESILRLADWRRSEWEEVNKNG